MKLGVAVVTDDFGGRPGPFTCYGGIKANSPAQELNITNIHTKRAAPNCKIGLPLNSLFPS